jgi:hypothetical protein
MFSGLIKITIPAVEFWEWCYEQVEATSENGLIHDVFDITKTFYSPIDSNLHLQLGNKTFLIPNHELHNFYYSYFEFKEDHNYCFGIPHYIENTKTTNSFLNINLFISTEDLDTCIEPEYIDLEDKNKIFDTMSICNGEPLNMDLITSAKFA